MELAGLEPARYSDGTSLVALAMARGPAVAMGLLGGVPGAAISAVVALLSTPGNQQAREILARPF